MKIYFKTSDKFKELQDQKLIPYPYAPAYDGESSCIDLYCMEDVTITPQTQNVLIPTGLHLALQRGQTAVILERGSIIKTPLKVRAGVIDPGYTAEIFVNCVIILKDVSTFFGASFPEPATFTFKAGDKLPFQILVVETHQSYCELSDQEYEKMTSNAKRKSGMIGSSNIDASQSNANEKN